MFVPTLLETRRPLASSGSLGTGAVSFLIHSALIAAVVYVSLNDETLEQVGRLIVDVPLLQAPAPRPPELPTFAAPPVAFSTLVIPTTVVPFIPPPSQEPFDAARYNGLGVEAPSPLGREAPARPVVRSDSLYSADMLEELPERIGGSAPRFPNLLRSAGIGGQVTVEFVIDTAGRVEAGSARVVASTHELFSQAALDAVASWLFRPGRLDGHPVRSWVRVPLNFVK